AAGVWLAGAPLCLFSRAPRGADDRGQLLRGDRRRAARLLGCARVRGSAGRSGAVPAVWVPEIRFSLQAGRLPSGSAAGPAFFAEDFVSRQQGCRRVLVSRFSTGSLARRPRLWLGG